MAFRKVTSRLKAASVICAFIGSSMMEGCSLPSEDDQGRGRSDWGMALGTGSDTFATASMVPVDRFDGRPIAPITGVRVIPSKELAELAEGPMSPEKAAALGSGAAAGGVGFAMLVPMAGGVGVGGLILLPLLFIPAAKYEDERQALIEAAKSFAFPAKLEDATLKRLAAADTASAAGSRASRAPLVEIRLTRFGFEGVQGEPACFVFDGELALIAEDAEIYRSQIEWGRYSRSADLPPVVCADTGDLAAHGGRLATKALSEAVIILAASIAHRIGMPPR